MDFNDTFTKTRARKQSLGWGNFPTTRFEPQRVVVDWYRLAHFLCFCTSLLLLKEILHYLTCMKPSRWWDIWYLPYQLVSQMFAIKSSTKLDYIDSHNISYPIHFFEDLKMMFPFPLLELCWFPPRRSSLGRWLNWTNSNGSELRFRRSGSWGWEFYWRWATKYPNNLPPPPKTNMTIPGNSTDEWRWTISYWTWGFSS